MAEDAASIAASTALTVANAAAAVAATAASAATAVALSNATYRQEQREDHKDVIGKLDQLIDLNANHETRIQLLEHSQASIVKVIWIFVVGFIGLLGDTLKRHLGY